jgi:oligopeptide transport system substrate-binding protein
MRTKIVSLFTLLILAGMVLAACTPAEQGAVVTVIVGGEVQVVTATPGAEPAGPKVVRIGIGIPGDVATLDPGLSEDTYSTTFVNATSVGLTWLKEADATLHPGMAASWDVSEDGKTYTFHLLEGVPWVRWDGEQVVQVMDCQDPAQVRTVTAQDFEYAIKRALAPETASPYAYVLAGVVDGAAAYNGGEGSVDDVKVHAVDPATLEVTFLEDVAYNVNIIGLWTAHAVPKWIIEGDDCTEARGERWFEPGFHQSYGPFALKEWVHDSTITIARNPFWPGTEAIPVAKLDELCTCWPWTARLRWPNMRPAIDVAEAFPAADQDRITARPVLSQEYRSAPTLCTYYTGSTPANIRR